MLVILTGKLRFQLVLMKMKQLDVEVSTPANDSHTCNWPRLAQRLEFAILPHQVSPLV